MKTAYNILVSNIGRKDTTWELGVVGPRGKLKEILVVCEYSYVDWIQLAEDKVRWRILETAEMKEIWGSHGGTMKIAAL